MKGKERQYLQHPFTLLPHPFSLSPFNHLLLPSASSQLTLWRQRIPASWDCAHTAGALLAACLGQLPTQSPRSSPGWLLTTVPPTRGCSQWLWVALLLHRLETKESITGSGQRMESTKDLDVFLDYPSFFDLQLRLEVSEGVFTHRFRLCPISAFTRKRGQMHMENTSL